MVIIKSDGVFADSKFSLVWCGEAKYRRHVSYLTIVLHRCLVSSHTSLNSRPSVSWLSLTSLHRPRSHELGPIPLPCFNSITQLKSSLTSVGNGTAFKKVATPSSRGQEVWKKKGSLNIFSSWDEGGLGHSRLGFAVHIRCDTLQRYCMHEYRSFYTDYSRGGWHGMYRVLKERNGILWEKISWGELNWIETDQNIILCMDGLSTWRSILALAVHAAWCSKTWYKKLEPYRTYYTIHMDSSRRPKFPKWLFVGSWWLRFWVGMFDDRGLGKCL